MGAQHRLSRTHPWVLDVFGAYETADIQLAGASFVHHGDAGGKLNFQPLKLPTSLQQAAISQVELRQSQISSHQILQNFQ
jgi:hypothetical protein